MFTIPHHAFEVPINIQQNDIDRLNHVNNTVYLKWVQEVAIANWEHITTAEQRSKWIWVVARHEIDYLRPCFLNDELLAYTWVVPAVERGSDRIVVFKNKATGKIVTQVKSNWVLVDPVTQRGTPITDEIKQLLGI
ncbi:MAG TPA: acyl-CoA thioesterase [Phnomibacter sp.]|nr:acyl-CoA thioesterase [Phnomibacter sp.]